MNISQSPCGQGRALSASQRRPAVQLAAFQPVYHRRVAARAGLSTATALVDDKNVPEGHKGLHGFLYGEGGAEEHDSSVGGYSVRKGEDEGSAVMPVSAYLESRDGEKPLGVYCVYDSQQRPQYIGFSRNMVLAIKGHVARVGPELAAHVRAMVYGNRSMATRTNLERGVQTWVDELLGGRVPPGNSDPRQRSVWEGISLEAAGGEAGGEAEAGAVGALAGPALLDRTHMSPAEAAAYEEKKLKMRKAMGEKMVDPNAAGGEGGHDHAHEEEDDLATRREKLMKAMNKGDWSAVIQAQTDETVAATATDPAAATAATASPGEAGPAASSSSSSAPGEAAPIASPFRDGGAGSGAGGARRPQVELTVAAVQAALEEVRPYLVADGGDVEVVEVENGVVYLRLQGACTSCPSQSATMKGGIERVIKNTFGDQVRDILQLDKTDNAATVELVDASLNMLRGAIHNFGGSVTVLSVEGGVCTIRYDGPAAIGKGVQGAVRDTFRDLKEVVLVLA